LSGVPAGWSEPADDASETSRE